MLAESQRLEAKINDLDGQLGKLPKGRLICVHNGKYYKWYQSDGKSFVYIHKKDRHLAEQLAVKKFLSLQREELIQQKDAINSYLKIHDTEKLFPEQLLSDDSEYKELLSPYFTPTSRKFQEWMNSPYDKNTKYPERLVHKAYSGNYVRSKSESIIDMLLYMNKIPFRYECALELGGNITYPDFTIRHPDTGKIFYWEHFGLMDEPEYRKNTFSKMQLYSSHGIIPGIQLITTYETKESPLSLEMVEKIIEYYFL